MKKLIKGLKMEDRKPAWLAVKLGVTDATVSYAISGKHPFSLKVCEKIFNLTGGDVTLEDLRPDLCELYKSYKCLQELFEEGK